MRRALVVGGVVAAFVISASPHLSNYTNGQPDRWASLPVHFKVNAKTDGTQIEGARSIGDVVAASFAAWTSVPNTNVAVANDGGDTRETRGNDGVNLVCFVCPGDFDEEDETLAVTFITVETSPNPGRVIDADIVFNKTVRFTKDGAAGVQDLQTVMTHEIGHFFGLDHSGVVKAMMFPFAPDHERRLAYDDAAAIATKYPGAQVVPTFSITGGIRLNNAAVFGAHVFAESQTAAEPFSAFNLRKTPISGASLADGNYRIDGVPNDSYVITAEPFDNPVENENLNGFASGFNRSSVQTNFTTRWR